MDLHIATNRQCNLIEQMWQHFRQSTIHPDVPDDQLKEARRLFFLGAAQMHSTLHGIAEAHAPETVFMISQFIDQEIENFRKELNVGNALILNGQGH